MERIEPSQMPDFLADYTLIDVRSPSEFAVGHIVGAKNIPLFTDEERAQVGTIYKRASPEKSLLKGLDFVGKKMSKYIGLAKKAAPDKKIIVYCWRGGKRSGSLSWLFDLAGFDVKTIQGGYKNYRKNAQQSLDNQTFNFVRIGGKTGTGKTEILHQLREKGEQILDLEALANHKGSAFGELGELPQPSNEQFENLIFHELNKLDFSKKIWLENESRGIGKIFMPEWFWNHFTTTPLINVEIPHALRVKRLVVDYAAFPKEVLIQKFTTIERKIGGNNLKVAVEAIEKNDFETAAEIALFWYDKTYTFGLGKKYNTEVKSLKFDHADISKIADTLIL